jgi:hypothetical protein
MGLCIDYGVLLVIIVCAVVNDRLKYCLDWKCLVVSVCVS